MGSGDGAGGAQDGAMFSRCHVEGRGPFQLAGRTVLIVTERGVSFDTKACPPTPEHIMFCYNRMTTPLPYLTDLWQRFRLINAIQYVLLIVR